jgi:hypothetical protein
MTPGRVLVPFASMSVLHAAGMLLRIFVGRPTKFGTPFRLLTFGLDPSLSHLDEMFGWISRGIEEHLVYKG